MEGSFLFMTAHSLLLSPVFAAPCPWHSPPVFRAASAYRDEDSRERSHASIPYARRSPDRSSLPRGEGGAARDKCPAAYGEPPKSPRPPARQHGHWSWSAHVLHWRVPWRAPPEWSFESNRWHDCG